MANAFVVFHDSSSAVTSQVTTNADGRAAATVARDAIVTVAVNPYEPRFTTVMGVQPGDVIPVASNRQLGLIHFGGQFDCGANANDLGATVTLVSLPKSMLAAALRMRREAPVGRSALAELSTGRG